MGRDGHNLDPNDAGQDAAPDVPSRPAPPVPRDPAATWPRQQPAPDATPQIPRRSARRAEALALVALTGVLAIAGPNRIVFDVWLSRFDLYTFFIPW
jgi:hypothetical protein